MKKQSRMESNRDIRRVLNRQGVDLTTIQYGCYGREVRLSGTLTLTDGTPFKGAMVEALLADFAQTLPGYYICGDTDDWKFTSDHISFVGEKREVYLANETDDDDDDIDLAG